MMAEDPTKRPTADEVLKVAGTLTSKAALSLTSSASAKANDSSRRSL